MEWKCIKVQRIDRSSQSGGRGVLFVRGTDQLMGFAVTHFKIPSDFSLWQDQIYLQENFKSTQAYLEAMPWTQQKIILFALLVEF